MNDMTHTSIGTPTARPVGSRNWPRLGVLALLVMAGGCAQQPPSSPSPEIVALQQRLQALEQRVETLDRYVWNLPSVPLRSRQEIEKNIQSLEAKRSALLVRYTDRHPDVREVDLSLRLLKLQLEMMDQARKASP